MPENINNTLDTAVNGTTVQVPVDLQRQKVRTLCSFYYDLQSERIRTGNRIVASLRPDLVNTTKKNIQTAIDSLNDGKTQDEKDKLINKILKICLADYHLLHEQYADKIRTKASLQKTIDRLGDELGTIKSSIDFDMVSVYDQMLEMEDSILKTLDREVKSHPMYDAFFARVSGCGTLISAICLSYINVHKCRHASALWRYAGLDVIRNPDTGVMEGHNRSHRVAQKYTDRDGNENVRMNLGYNPILKTKVTEILASGILKAYGQKCAAIRKLNDQDGGNRPMPQPDGYAKIYYDYKNRLDNRPDTKDYSPAHKNRMAIRYMAKMFLQDLWNTWRQLEGYPPEPPYAVSKLGMNPHGGDNTPSSPTDDVT